jgi:structure-specific endonuclease subunit SLX1
VPSFARWPLELRFFSQDIYESWLAWTQNVKAPSPKDIKITLDFPQDRNDDSNSVNPALQPQLQVLDATFAPMKEYVKKSLALSKASSNPCSCCLKNVDMSSQMVLVCSNENCKATSHMACLSKTFLDSAQDNEVIPIQGHCPKCKSTLKWADLVRELTLRVRGDKDLARLLKPKRQKKAPKVVEVDLPPEFEDENSEDELDFENVIDEPNKYAASSSQLDDWEASSVASACSNSHTSEDIVSSKPHARYDLSVIIEDSDDWEVLD